MLPVLLMVNALKIIIKEGREGRKDGEKGGREKTFLGCAGKGPDVQQQTWP